MINVELGTEIINALRKYNCLWHRTSISSLKSIIQSGMILPNDGRFTVTYPQSENCLSRFYSSISLFDLGSRPEEAILGHAWKWASFFKDQGTATVIIGIKASQLSPEKLIYPWSIPHEEKLRLSNEGKTVLPTHIPEIEVLYQGPISCEKFEVFCIAKKVPGFIFEMVEVGPDSISKIEELSGKWCIEEEAKLQKRLKEPLTMADYFADPVLYESLFKE